MPQKAIKGQDVEDFLADHPIPGSSKLYDDLPDKIAEVNVIHVSSEEQEKQLFFDGASRIGPKGNIVEGVRVVIIFPHNYVIPRVFSLPEPCSNNVSKYNALLIGMQLAEETSKRTMIQSSSSTRFAGSTKSDMKTRYPITTQPLIWQRSLKTSTLTMYQVSKMRMHMHWHISLSHWPFQLAPQRRCLSTVVTCTIANSLFKTVKL